MELRDKIGKIEIDYSRYLGEDLYCDGEIEDIAVFMHLSRIHGIYHRPAVSFPYIDCCFPVL